MGDFRCFVGKKFKECKIYLGFCQFLFRIETLLQNVQSSVAKKLGISYL